MTISRIRRLIYGLIIFILLIIVFYYNLTNNWLTTNTPYSKQLWYNNQKTVIPVDDIELVSNTIYD